jgi:hypothetical protein
MKCIMALDAAEQQALARPIFIANLPTFGASLRGVIGIDTHDHAARENGFISQHSMQLGKRPLRVHSVRLPSFDRNWLSSFTVLLASSLASPGAIPNAVQLLYADDGMGILLYDALGYRVIGLHFQPSLSSTDRPQAAGRATSAFLLQAFTQSCIVVGSGTHAFPRVETSLPFGVRSHGEVAYTHIYPDHLLVLLRGGIWSLNLYRDQQVKLFVWLVVPQTRPAYLGPIEKRLEVLFVAIVGNDDTTSQGEKAHTLALLETVIFAILIHQGGRNKLRRFVQTLKSLLGEACFALLQVLLEFGPQSFVGCGYIPLNTTGHLRRQLKPSAKLQVTSPMHLESVARLALLKSVARDEVERIPIGKLSSSKLLALLRCGLQFEFRGQGVFHTYSLAKEVWEDKCSEKSTRSKGSAEASAFLSSHRLKAGGYPERILDETIYMAMDKNQ